MIVGDRIGNQDQVKWRSHKEKTRRAWFPLLKKERETGLPITEKHGMNGPASGFFEEWQAEHIRALIPERHRDVLVALAEADPGVVSIRDYFYSLPDLTAEQFQKQIEDFDNQTKESDQVRGEPQGRAITIPLGPSSDGHS